jgi:murein DD-endopeptidase MepM/ murein hydrolase activator NlpD
VGSKIGERHLVGMVAPWVNRVIQRVVRPIRPSWFGLCPPAHPIRVPALALATALLLIVSSFANLQGPQGLANAEERSGLFWRLKNLASQRLHFRQKKKESLQKAYIHENRLIQKQRELAAARNSLARQENALESTRDRLGSLERDLDKTVGETTRLKANASLRIRQIYMGERLSLLQMLFEVDDLATFLDKLYFQQKMIAQDKMILTQFGKKSQLLLTQKQQLQEHRQRLAQTIDQIQGLQKNISVTMQEEGRLRAKYWNDAQNYERLERQLLAESASITQQLRAMARMRHKVARSTGRYMWPVYGRITSNFGYRVHPIHRRSIMHTGLDISRPTGTPVVAADGGQVFFAGWRGGYGRAIILNHGTQGSASYATLYGHLSGIAVASGSTVSKGQVIGYVGSTGFSTGPHLHFEVRVNGSPVNPLGFLR